VPRTQSPVPAEGLKDALLAEIRKTKAVFYNTVVAQAQKIDMAGDRVMFTFSPAQRALRDRFDTDRPWLESVAQRIAGRKIAFASAFAESAPAPAAASAANQPAKAAGTPAAAPAAAPDKKSLKEQALADASVQALLEVFPAEIRDVEEM